MDYNFKHFYEWFKTEPYNDYKSDYRQYCLYYDIPEACVAVNDILFEWVDFVEFSIYDESMIWHVLSVYTNEIHVSLTDYSEDDYRIDTTFFNAPVTEESYFQYCTTSGHKHLSTEDFYDLVSMSLMIRGMKNVQV